MEYQLKLGSFRIDYFFMGYDAEGNPSALLMELKQWSYNSISLSNKGERLIDVSGRNGKYVSVHPSYQAWSYRVMLDNYNAEVQQGINVTSCAYLFNYDIPTGKTDILKSQVFEEELKEAALIESGQEDELCKLFGRLLVKGDNFEVYNRLDRSEIRPSKALQDKVEDMLLGNPSFILVDSQLEACQRIVNAVRSGMQDGRKRVLLVKGGPGTGKSVIAIQAMAQLLIRGIPSSDFRIKEDLKAYKSKNIPLASEKGRIALYCPYVTKTSAPREVYENIMTRHSATGKKWTIKELEGLFIGGGKFRNKPDSPIFAGVLVDEAHRLKASDRFSSGTFYLENIMLSAYTSIFFVDDHQRVTTEDFGSSRILRKFAEKNGYEVEEMVLTTEFRCSGGDEYLSWLDGFLYGKTDAKLDCDGSYDFRVFDDPEMMHEAIKKLDAEMRTEGSPLTSRVAAGYCWSWISDKNPSAYDIIIPRDGKDPYAHRWNITRKNNPFAIGEASVDEVGCIHTVQGLEFDYVGVIIGPDLRYVDGKIITDKSVHPKTDVSLKNYSFEDRADIDEIIRNIYRVLMTRGQKGCYVYCVDKPLADLIRKAIS